MENEKFGALILTHGRPDNVKTLRSLRNQGYTGPVYLVVDNEDARADEYLTTYGEKMVRIFDKKKYADMVDEGNNFDERRTITHARNASFDIARDLGLRYFIQLDDDYTRWEYRISEMDGVAAVKNLNRIFDYLVGFYKKTSALTIAIAQGGDFIGGKNSTNFKHATLKRKCMNTFICDVKRPFKFIGAMNEDVNTYTSVGSRGGLFFTIPLLSVVQGATQSQAGGITDMYLKYGTYVKAFTTVMMMPSCVRVAMMGEKHRRLHHRISWDHCVPKILDEKYCKGRDGKGMPQVDQRE